MIFLTGATGYLGGYVLVELARRSSDRFALLVRAQDEEHARAKLWRGLQLHLDREAFHALWPRLVVVRGDLHAPGLGIAPPLRQRLLEEVDSVLHVAASLNRMSAKACLNTNLRGTLSVIGLARDVAERSGLRRYSYVSTVAVAGKRHREVVQEDEAIDWSRSDYDPYGRTKKFCEHMASELLRDIPRTIFRPSIVMGDSRHPRTTQFDMVRATAMMADLPAVPLAPTDRLDIVPADWVGRAIATLHLEPEPRYGIYHLSAGTGAPTAEAICRALEAGVGRRPRLMPRLVRPFDLAFRGMSRLPRGNPVQGIGVLMKVFMPYITYDTVFANERAVEALGEVPPSFVDYGVALYRWAKANRFRFPYEDL